jgi:hypothetical protein
MTDPFARRWTDSRRQAVTNAVLRDGHKLAAVLRGAASGEFGEPFDMPYRTAWGYVQAERRRQQKARSKGEQLEELYRRGWDLMDGEFDRIESRVDAGEELDFVRLYRAVKVVRSLVGVANHLQNVQHAAERPERAETPDTQPSGFVQRLAQDARADTAEDTASPEPDGTTLTRRHRGSRYAGDTARDQGLDAARFAAAQRLLRTEPADSDASDARFS